MTSIRQSRAYTLVELVIVVLVLGILAAVAAAKFIGTTDQAVLSTAQSFERNLINAEHLYMLKFGSPPRAFMSWVALGTDGTSRNLIRITPSLRSQLIDPHGDVLDTSSKTITLNFSNGLIAQYDINADGEITSTYSGTGVD